MPENNSYCLWIIPEDDAYSITSRYIAKLSEAYNFPRFEPHVTLLCRIHSTDNSKIRALAESISPFRIRLPSKPGYRISCCRCLFLKAQEAPELMGTFSKASDAFGYEGEPFYPHLESGLRDSIQTKREMIQKLGEIPEIEFEARQLSLVRASGEIPISSWKFIERFPFANVP